MSQDVNNSARTIADRVIDMVRRLVEKFGDASATHAMLAAFDDDQTLWALLFERRAEVHGLNLIHNTLLAQHLLTLATMYDKRDPRRDNRASLPSIMHHLADKDVIRQLVEDAGSRHFGGGHRPSDRNASSATRSIMRARIRYNALETMGGHRDRMQYLRHLRDQFVAHALVQPPTQSERPAGWLDRLRSDVAPIISDLCSAVEGRDPQFAEADEEWSRRATAFWERVRTGLSQHEKG